MSEEQKPAHTFEFTFADGTKEYATGDSVSLTEDQDSIELHLEHKDDGVVERILLFTRDLRLFRHAERPQWDA